MRIWNHHHLTGIDFDTDFDFETDGLPERVRFGSALSSPQCIQSASSGAGGGTLNIQHRTSKFECGNVIRRPRGEVTKTRIRSGHSEHHGSSFAAGLRTQDPWCKSKPAKGFEVHIRGSMFDVRPFRAAVPSAARRTAEGSLAHVRQPKLGEALLVQLSRRLISH